MMFADATPAPAANAGGMPINWFDVVVVVVLAFGLFRGRHNGMSKELLPLLQWGALVPVCGLGYPIVGGLLESMAGLDKFWSALLAYLGLAFVIFIVFSVVKRLFAEKLAKSSAFKDGEYPLGMVAGLVRYACVLLFVLALLNARFFTPAETAEMVARDKQDLGGGEYAGNYFPHLFQIQDMVFKQSFLGSCIKKELVKLLIVTGQPGEAPQKNAPAAPPKKPVIHIGNQ